MSHEAGPSDDYKRGYSAGYDQAQFDLAQVSDSRTLLDEFAMAALTGGFYVRPWVDAADFAAQAYEIANAMLTAREGK